MNLEIKQTDKPVSTEILADSIVKIGDGMKALNNTRLSRKALVALIHDHSKLSKRHIEIVLNNLAQLESIWLKPAPPKTPSK